MTRNVTNGPERGCPYLAGAFRDRIGHDQYLRSLLVKHQMVIAKVGPANMPMETLRFHVERKHVGKQLAQVLSNLFHLFAIEVGCGLRGERLGVQSQYRTMISH